MDSRESFDTSDHSWAFPGLPQVKFPVIYNPRTKAFYRFIVNIFLHL